MNKCLVVVLFVAALGLVWLATSAQPQQTDSPQGQAFQLRITRGELCMLVQQKYKLYNGEAAPGAYADALVEKILQGQPLWYVDVVVLSDDKYLHKFNRLDGRPAAVIAQWYRDVHGCEPNLTNCNVAFWTQRHAYLQGDWKRLAEEFVLNAQQDMVRSGVRQPRPGTWPPAQTPNPPAPPYGRLPRTVIIPPPQRSIPDGQ